MYYKIIVHVFISLRVYTKYIRICSGGLILPNYKYIILKYYTNLILKYYLYSIKVLVINVLFYHKLVL